MPNQITASGLEVATLQELVAQFTAAFQAIYGPDINLEQDTPDGQMMMIFLQSVIDLEDLLVQINNGFDPDLAIGRILDQRVALNGIQRKAGTFTVTNVTVVVAQALTLQGLDTFPDSPFTISDAAGTKFLLEETIALPSSGTYVLAFRAELPGATLTLPNTLTTVVTVVLGVTSVNNPTTYTTLGLNEETDAELRIRRQKSVAIGSQGYREGLLAALYNISGVTIANVYENNTAATDINGIPSHSIWVIVGGTGSDADIAQAIYTKRNAGCGMKGTVTEVIIQSDGIPIVMRWDIVEDEQLYLNMTLESIDGVNVPNTTLIVNELPNKLAPLAGVGQEVNINEIATLVQQIDPNTLVTFPSGFGLSLVSTSGPFVNIAEPSALNKKFVLQTSNIDFTVI